MFDETPTVGLPGTGITQANFFAGPAYLIWTMAVTVASGLSTNMIPSAACLTGAVCEDQKPPNACARGLIAGTERRAPTQTPTAAFDESAADGDRFKIVIASDVRETVAALGAACTGALTIPGRQFRGTLFESTLTSPCPPRGPGRLLRNGSWSSGVIALAGLMVTTSCGSAPPAPPAPPNPQAAQEPSDESGSVGCRGVGLGKSEGHDAVRRRR